MEQKYVDKIPKKLLELFSEEKNKHYKIEINPEISLADQNLQRKTLVILAMLNLNYWCENEEEKQEILKMYADNDKKMEKEIRERYNPDNLFKKKEQISKDSENNELEQENKQLIEYKELNIIQKILQKIMKFFKRKEI